ncbi:Rubrerythrin [Carpediemonas membranifera]|uniref:Rubrerythrin n=1 Tax=Carpediemonas membranifera TaxID=201153 RepID=A0A8J6B061_9EUKA|nr:Rubrerythrin [Carpediemonas membranifera]|eukprot:KAG9392673.1 Rubrerythrin [Carpediemonas membranifera]
MSDTRGTRTHKNLMAAFAGESGARNRYDYYASKAQKEGYHQIAAIFRETALQESQHAKLWLKYVSSKDGEDVEISATFPALSIGTTEQNLEAAANGEHEEFTEMYPTFAKIAREEGFDRIARSFELIGEVEKSHHARFTKLLQNFREGEIFVRLDERRWICLNCGYIHVGKEAPKVCPACSHPQGYFKLFVEDY